MHCCITPIVAAKADSSGRRNTLMKEVATLCIAAYGFLVSERETIPLQFPKLIARGAPPLRPERHVPNSIHYPAEIERCPRQNSVAMPLLRRAQQLEHYRAGLGQLAQKAADEILDAEFEEIKSQLEQSAAPSLALSKESAPNDIAAQDHSEPAQ
jgi:hypothetical protein